MPAVHVEFFGVARSRANVRSLTVDAGCLGEVLMHLRTQCPAISELCMQGDELTRGWLLNVNGARFTRDLTTPLHEGDSVLLIPADAGG